MKTTTKKTAAPKKSAKKTTTAKATTGAVVHFADMGKLNKDSLEALNSLLGYNAKDKDIKSLQKVVNNKKVTKAEWENLNHFVDEVLASITEDMQTISAIQKTVKGLKTGLKTTRI